MPALQMIFMTFKSVKKRHAKALPYLRALKKLGVEK